MRMVPSFRESLAVGGIDKHYGQFLSGGAIAVLETVVGVVAQILARASHLQEESGELFKTVSVCPQSDIPFRIDIESVPDVPQARKGVSKIHGIRFVAG
jgi:hypothetical protein